MKILPLTPAQSSFVEIEIIGRHVDDEDESVASKIEVVAEHFEKTSATGTPGLAIVDAALLRRLILDEMNSIDDAITSGRTQEEYNMNGQQARAMHKAATSLRSKIPEGLSGTDLTVANTIAEQIGGRAFLMLGAKNKLGDANSLSFQIGRNVQGVTHIRVQLDPDDTYTMQFLKVRKLKNPPFLERKVLSEASGLHAGDLRRIIEQKTGMYTNL